MRSPRAAASASSVVCSRPSEKFGTDSSGRGTRVTLGARGGGGGGRVGGGGSGGGAGGDEAYYEARAQRVRRLVLRARPLRGAGSPGWDEECERRQGTARAPPSARTLDIACGTGFADTASPRRDRRPRREPRRCSRSPPSVSADARVRRRRRARASVRGRLVRADRDRALLRASRGGGPCPVSV